MPSRAGEARLRSGGLVLPSVENVAILKRKKGGKCSNTHRPVWGTSPGFVQSKFFAPVRVAPPTGATALEVHKMNRHSRKNGGKPGCQHVPEEVSHGVSSFREAAPQRQPIREYRERQFRLSRAPTMFPHGRGLCLLCLLYTSPSPRDS